VWEAPAVELPETRYALSGDVSIAYQVHGEGPIDLVVVPAFVANVELMWESELGTAAFYRRLGEFVRVIRFDKRGTGLSDRVTGIADMETRMDDVRAVMDAAGVERAAVMGASEGGPLAALFAATYPERTLGLILWSSFPRSTRAPGYPGDPPARKPSASPTTLPPAGVLPSSRASWPGVLTWPRTRTGLRAWPALCV
jgi:pimeloyl-ACP methyl ester carboxylesterase